MPTQMSPPTRASPVDTGHIINFIPVPTLTPLQTSTLDTSTYCFVVEGVVDTWTWDK